MHRYIDVYRCIEVHRYIKMHGRTVVYRYIEVFRYVEIQNATDYYFFMYIFRIWNDIVHFSAIRNIQREVKRDRLSVQSTGVDFPKPFG